MQQSTPNSAAKVLSFRNDRMGARLMTLMNTIRVSRDYGLPYAFAWKMDGRTSEELKSPTEIFDEAYFNAHYVPLDDFKRQAGDAVNLEFLPAGTTEADLRSWIASGQSLLCEAANLLVLPWEDREAVADRYAAAIEELRFSDAIADAMQFVDQTLMDSGTAFHIRRGDIIHDPITSNQLWSNKYIPREFYECLAERLLQDPDQRILVFSDEPREVSRLKDTSNRILGATDVVPDSLSLAQRDLIELYAMSRCNVIIGPPQSGFSMTAALMGNSNVIDVRDQLTEDEYEKSLDLLALRLISEPERFLTPGDVGQSLPFAVDHLNTSGRDEIALTLLDTVHERGFHKLFFYGMRSRQHMRAGQFETVADMLAALADDPIDHAVPGRLERYWATLYRLNAIAHAHLSENNRASSDMALALWHGASDRPAILTLSQLVSVGVIEAEEFAIPFDPLVRRPLPPTVINALINREGHESALPPGIDKPQWVLPTDLIARDWQRLLGKSLGRGFGEPEVARKSLEMFDLQFARHIPQANADSVRSTYALAMNDVEKAIGFSRSALAELPDHPLVLKRAAAAFELDDVYADEALGCLERAAEIEGPSSLYAAALGELVWRQGDRERGVDVLEAACEGEFVLPEVLFLAARANRQYRRDHDRALELVERALENAPHVRRFMRFRVDCLKSAGKHDQVEEAVQNIVRRFGETKDLEAFAQVRRS